MAADTDHFDALDSLADTHQKKLAESLVTLENRIADLVATAPLQDGKLFDLEWAVNARNELRQAINEDYLTEVDSIIRDYDQVAVDAATMLGEYGDIVQLDQDVIGQLQQMTFQGFEDLGAEHLDIISKQVYESTLTGATFANSVNAVREVVGKDMARYASQQVHDSLMQFDRAVNTKIALDSGAEKFKYRGSDDSKTRSFCRKHVDKVYTIDEINEIWQGEWAGKSSSNAFATAGGYNCRHRFRPVFDDELEEQQVDEQIPVEQKEKPKIIFDKETEIIGNDKEAKAMQNALSKLSAEQIAIINKIGKPKKIVTAKGSRGVYMVFDKTVSADPFERGGSVLRHEYGHHVDFTLGNIYQPLSVQSKEFVSAFDKQRKALNFHKSKERPKAMLDIHNDLYNVDVRSVGSKMIAKKVIKNDELANYSDVFDALSAGAFSGMYGGVGHGASYFKTKDARLKEAFANLFALYGSPEWKTVKSKTPILADGFEKIMKEI